MADDPQLEAFLRQFRPRRPAPLPQPAKRPAHSRWMLAAAATVLLAVGVWRWAPWHDRTSAPTPAASSGRIAPTLSAFHAAVRGGTHESVLDEMDARLLPDPTRPGGALRVLADVSRDHEEP